MPGFGVQAAQYETELSSKEPDEMLHGSENVGVRVADEMMEEGVEPTTDTSGLLSNLELVRMLQDSKTQRHRKIEVAYQFIRDQEMRSGTAGNSLGESKFRGKTVDSMAMPQFVAFLSEWSQSAILWSCKPQQLSKNASMGQEDGSHKGRPAHLDSRYWAILRWCLVCGHLHRFSSVSPSIMRALNLYVIAVIQTGKYSETSTLCQSKPYDRKVEESPLTEESLRSIEVLLLDNEKSFRPDLEHWVSLALTALSNLSSWKNLSNLGDGNVVNLLYRLFVLIVEGFSRFVANHPNRKKIFTSVVENLLEPLLIAHSFSSRPCEEKPSLTGGLSTWQKRLLRATEEVLEKGLFHAAHIGSFQEVCTVLAGEVDADIDSQIKIKVARREGDMKMEDHDKGMQFSYHRLLFRKLDHFRKERVQTALVELGWIFETYSRSLRAHQSAVYADFFGVKSKGKPQVTGGATGNTIDAEEVQGGKMVDSTSVVSNNNSKGSSGTSSGIVDKNDQYRETLFTVFAEFTGPFIRDLRSCWLAIKLKDTKLSLEHLASARVLLSAVTSLFKAATNEHTYVPTEDSASHTHFTFLMECFSVVIEVGKLLPELLNSFHVSESEKDDSKSFEGQVKVNLPGSPVSLAIGGLLSEVTLAIKYFMELEYRVAEQSLEEVWVILLTDVTLQDLNMNEVTDGKSSLKNFDLEAVGVACQMIGIFSDLRQVDRVLFTLCATLRRFIHTQSLVDLITSKLKSSSGSCSSHSHETSSKFRDLNVEAIEFLVCAKPFLSAVAAAMHALPEGQVAEFLKLLTSDSLESVTMIETGIQCKNNSDSENLASRTHHTTITLRGLIELYSHMLENVNITMTNSIQAGKSVQNFMQQIVIPKVGKLIDFCMDSASHEECKISLDNVRKKQKVEKKDDLQESVDSRKRKGTKSELITWHFVYVLRMYMASHSLYKQCISSMPPKAAKKARRALVGYRIDYHKFSLEDIFSHLSAGVFFDGVGRGVSKVSDLLVGIKEKMENGDLPDCPALLYSLDCIAMQSLVELNGHIEALSFLVLKYSRDSLQSEVEEGVEPVSGKPDDFNTVDGEANIQKKLQKLLKSLKQESRKLVKNLLKGIPFLIDAVGDESVTDANVSIRKRKLEADDSLDIPGSSGREHQSRISIEASLTSETLPIRRWHLLCKTFDVWAEFAVDKDLQKFICFVLTSFLITHNRQTAADCSEGKGEPIRQEISVKHITDQLLSNVLFYEEKSFRRVFASTFIEELKSSLLFAFGEWPQEWLARDMLVGKEDHSRVAQEWSDLSLKVEAQVGEIGEEQDSGIFLNKKIVKELAGQLEVTCAHHKSHLSVPSREGSSKPKTESSAKQANSLKFQCSGSVLKALSKCTGLADQLSVLPPAYFKTSDITPCSRILLCFERLVVHNLLQIRMAALMTKHAAKTLNTVDLPTVFSLMKALSSCRRALLALTSSENADERMSPFLDALPASVHWLSLSFHAVATCLVDILQCSNLSVAEKSQKLLMGRCVLHAGLKWTASLVAFIYQRTFKLEVRRWAKGETGLLPASDEVKKDDLKHASKVKAEEEGFRVHSLHELLSANSRKLDKLIQCRSRIEQSVNFRNPQDGKRQSESDDIPSSTEILHFKSWYGGLTLTTSLCSYFWSLDSHLIGLVKESSLSEKPVLFPVESMCLAESLGHSLTKVLVSVLVPNGSDAILLVGEEEVDRSRTSAVWNAKSGKHGAVVVIENSQSRKMLNREEDEEDSEEEEGKHLRYAFGGDGTGLAEEKYEDGSDEEEEGTDIIQETQAHSKEEDHGRIAPGIDRAEIEYSEKTTLQRSALAVLMESSGQEKSDVIGELYLGAAGYLKLQITKLSHFKEASNLQEFSKQGYQSSEGLPPSSDVLLGAGHLILLKAGGKLRSGQCLQFGWLVGLVKYMEAIGGLLPYLKSPLSPLAFSRLLNMHIYLMGSVCPAEDSLHSYTMSNPLNVKVEEELSIVDDTPGNGTTKEEEKVASVDVFRAAVSSSLGILLKSAPRHHLVLACHSIKRALVGASEESHWASGLELRGVQGGKVGRGVAAGIQCLSIAMEALSGRKRLRLLANHFNEFSGAIFNVINFLEGPELFTCASMQTEVQGRVDERMVESGPVVLQCLKVMTTVASRDAIYPMKACHVALALQSPVRIFRPIIHSGVANHKFVQTYLGAEQSGDERRVSQTAVRISTDLGVKLYVSCCRLLCSLIRHRRRESGHCIALLADSARVLLHCLEATHWPTFEEGTRVWSTKMATYCATWLRRIYEEMGEHKETLGKYCCHILSDYLSVLSGHGPHAAGLMRDVEAALRPGAYVLVDACSANDLQQLHASLGEGPRRNALLTLRRQYQQQFKYTGKV